MTLQLDKGLKTNIEEIDIHHEGLREKIDELITAIEEGEHIAAIKKLAIFFESFLISHFALEEVLLKRFACPDYTYHYEQHIQLTKNFSGLLQLIATKGMSPDFRTDARDFITEWWKPYINHVNSADIQLADFLKTVF